MKKTIYFLSLFLFIGLVFVATNTIDKAEASDDYYSTFDLDNDGSIGATDLSMVASYIGDDDQVNCYQHYMPSLPDMNIAYSTASNLDAGVWCSALLGILNSSYNDPSSYNQIADVNDDGCISASDFAQVASWYGDGDDDNCFARFVDTYDASNYEVVDWCNGLYQGISDFYGNEEATDQPVPEDPDETYYNTFDLNEDTFIGVEDFSMVAEYIGNDDQAACYEHYMPSLPDMNIAYSTASNLDAGVWCSALLGILNSSYNDPSSYNQIADVNDDGCISASDFAQVASWYGDGDDDNCFARFVDTYDASNYEVVDWCNGLYQGISDFYGNGEELQINNVAASDITEASAMISWTTNIAADGHVQYGTSTMQMAEIGYASLVTEHEIMLDSLLPGTLYYYLVFSSIDHGVTRVTSDTYTFTTEGAADSGDEYDALVDVVEAKAQLVTSDSARIWWRASMGSIGEYRYATSENALQSATWISEGVANHPDDTGNMFASQVDLTGLGIDAEYYVEVKKYYTNYQNDARVYGNPETIIFSTLGSLDVIDEDNDDDNDTPVSVDPSLTNRLKGKILLQVENNGEAWYVKPDTGKKIYMPDGDAAYSLMRNDGLGITNVDISKIPVGFEDRFDCLDSDSDGLCDKLEEGLGTDPYDADSDDDGYDDGTEVKSDHDPLGSGELSYDTSLGNRLKGKILLQVETNGEAWYINPDDGKRYYMPDGPSAYQIMRYLSLGITNSDLAKIAE